MEDQNLWWKNPKLIEKDEEYLRWAESKIKWVPAIFEKIRKELKPFSLHFLFGPRQVGKTTVIKLLINSLLHRNINPLAVMYYKCDKLSDYKELDLILSKYFEVRESEGIKTSYIFLDEITFIKEWYRTIKYYIDIGKFKNDVLLLSGSLSMFVTREIETFPGRRGQGKNFIMHPLTFREFLSIVNPVLFNQIKKFSLKEITMTELKKCFKLIPWLNEIYDAFSKYLTCGGFPLSIKSFLEKKRVNEGIKYDYLSWIKADLAKLRRDEVIAKRVLKAVIEKVPSVVSWNSIAKEYEVRSHKSVITHVHVLENLFLLNVLNYIDPNKCIEIPYKGKKIHLSDPFLYDVFADWCFTNKPDDPIIVESTVASHLARKYDVFYWKNRREINVVVREKTGLLGIEVKYREKPAASKIVVGRIKDTVFLSKNSYSSSPLIIPASLFLACLEI